MGQQDHIEYDTQRSWQPEPGTVCRDMGGGTQRRGFQWYSW